ncbi:MAG TPA: peptide ligase PGM1-related protein [Gemmatimonadota bacterium]|nr:peptide ligase PGM1-related protein [Gemmatimonadota bacterium]
MTRVFVHSPSEAPDAPVVVTRMPDFERLGERALLLARPGDVVCLAHPVEPGYLEFLGSLSIGPRAEDVLVIPGVVPGTGLSQRLCADADSLDRLASRLIGFGPILVSPFFATPAADALSRALGERLARPAGLLGGPPALVRRLHEKRVTRRLARRLGIPIAPGEVVRISGSPAPSSSDLSALRAAIQRRSSETGRAIVRGSSGASGSSTFTADARGIEASLEAIAGRTDNRAYVVEPLYEAAASPNVEVIVEEGALRAAATDQLLDGALAYQGSVHPSGARRLPEMLASARALAAWMRGGGFAGRAGFDFVERTGQSLPGYFLTEINPRINGASYPLALLGRLARRAERLGVPTPAAFRTRSVASSARDFDDLARLSGGLLYDPARGEGVVPWSVAALEFGKVGIASFAASPERAEEIFADFASRAEAFDPSPGPTPVRA